MPIDYLFDPIGFWRITPWETFNWIYRNDPAFKVLWDKTCELAMQNPPAFWNIDLAGCYPAAHSDATGKSTWGTVPDPFNGVATQGAKRGTNGRPI
ncbi:MAG: hypothetical protein ACRDHZ_13475 [Ktedonobacteraceae bacterium]